MKAVEGFLYVECVVSKDVWRGGERATPLSRHAHGNTAHRLSHTNLATLLCCRNSYICTDAIINRGNGAEVHVEGCCMEW